MISHDYHEDGDVDHGDGDDHHEDGDADHKDGDDHHGDGDADRNENGRHCDEYNLCGRIKVGGGEFQPLLSPPAQVGLSGHESSQF